MDVLGETIAIPVWSAAAAVAAMMAFAVLLRFDVARPLVGPVLGLGALLLVLLLGAAALDGLTAARQLAERQALDQRRLELSRRAAEPGSPLNCLAGVSSAVIERACEKMVFASPQSVALATAHAAAQLTLLADALAYASRAEPRYAGSVAGLRRAVENDSYGIYAQVLMERDGCKPDACAAFALLRDPDTIKLHMTRGAYAGHLARHAVRWSVPSAAESLLSAIGVDPLAFASSGTEAIASTGAKSNDSAASEPHGEPVQDAPLAPAAERPRHPIPLPRPVAAASSLQAAPRTAAPAADESRPAASAPEAAAPAPIARRPDKGPVPLAASVLPHLDFPSASSIPPISIMRPEPRTPVAEQPSAAPKPQEAPAVSPDPSPAR